MTLRHDGRPDPPVHLSDHDPPPLVMRAGWSCHTVLIEPEPLRLVEVDAVLVLICLLLGYIIDESIRKWYIHRTINLLFELTLATHLRCIREASP